MIYFYSGTPGSGKSLHVARDIYHKLFIKKQNVIANFPLNQKILDSHKRRGEFLYVDTFDMSAQFFIEYAIKNHKRGKENQTLAIIDECQIIYNPRSTLSDKNRIDWINFYTQHRKWGYNFILISQFDKLVDKQIRNLFEYDVKHRKVNNFKFMRFVPISIFTAVTYWYGVRDRIDCEFFLYHKKYANLYDSYRDFSNNIEKIESNS